MGCSLNFVAFHITFLGIKEALQMYFNELSETLMHPLEVAKLLCDEKCISEAELNEIKRLEGSFLERNTALLSIIRTAVSLDHTKLKQLASVLSKFEETKMLAERINSDNSE